MRLNLFFNTKNLNSFVQCASIPLQIVPFEFESAVNFIKKKEHLLETNEFFNYGKIRAKVIFLDSKYYESEVFKKLSLEAMLDGIWHDNPIINTELHLMYDLFRKRNKKLLKA